MTKKFVTYGCLFATTLACISATSFAGGGKRFSEHYENKSWDANKPPVVDEPAINPKYAAGNWEKAMRAASTYCDSKRSLIASNGSRLEAVGVKEHNVEVRGAFLRFRTCLLPEPEKGKAAGIGWVDLTSWDSGLAARDRRVTRYVFGVETPDQSIAPFEFEVTPWKLPAVPVKPGTPVAADTWNANAKAVVNFRGTPITVEFPVTVTNDGGKTHMLTNQPFRLDFMNELVESGFRQMMELCNHHFLAAFSLVNLDLNLVPREWVGTLGPAASQNPEKVKPKKSENKP